MSPSPNRGAAVCRFRVVASHYAVSSLGTRQIDSLCFVLAVHRSNAEMTPGASDNGNAICCTFKSEIRNCGWRVQAEASRDFGLEASESLFVDISLFIE